MRSLRRAHPNAGLPAPVPSLGYGHQVRIFTIGHSTHPIEEFVELLQAHSIGAIADVRTIAKSRHNPQFNEEELAASLPQQHISYRRIQDLGGLRHSRKDSPNGAWRNASFRGYADYMQTQEFAAGLTDLMDFASAAPTAIMCAEAVPWRCHRSLIGDALLVRGVEVLDIMSATSAKEHTLTRFAKVDGESISYPPDGAVDATTKR
jgi:uncharacterized protein (DUF488 family)